jgi:hypothetical protein
MFIHLLSTGTPSKHLFRISIVLGLIGAIISSCTALGNTDIAPPPSSTVPIQPSPSPTLTPTHVQDKVLLLDSDQSPPAVSQTISSTLSVLAQVQGWEFTVSKDRSIQEFETGTRVVVVLPPDPGLESVSSEYPEIQFLSIGIPGLQPFSNLSILGSEGFREDQMAFIAGYISSVITKDWRSGLINQASSEWQEVINQSFINGMVYYCGICQLTYPPYYDYPILTTLSEDASDLEWGNAADLLISQAVETVFIYTNDLNLSVLEHLSQNGLVFFGLNPPPNHVENSWIATIRWAPETNVESHWDDLVSQSGGWVEEMPIIVEDVNESILSTGKQRWIQEVIDDVIRGYIGTGFDPEIVSP